MGPLKGRPAWNEVKPPSDTANMISVSKPDGWAGSASLSSTEQPQRSEQAGGMKSNQSNVSIKGAGVGKSQQTPPPSNPNAHMLKDGGKY